MAHVEIVTRNGIRWILPTVDAKIPGVNLTYRKLAKRTNYKRRKK